MNIEIGEYAVGAYLKHIIECDVVDYKVKDQSGGLKSLPEIDVIGFKLQRQKHEKPIAYLCEVKTHIKGLAKKAGEKDRVAQVLSQFTNMESYARKNLGLFDVKYMFWAPKVTHAELINEINRNYSRDMQFINSEYSKAIRELIEFSHENPRITDNPFVRSLQIITHLNEYPVVPKSSTQWQSKKVNPQPSKR